MEELVFNTVLNAFDEEETECPIVHLRIQKRNARKAITIVEGLERDICKRILKDIRKTFNTNGALKIDDEGNFILQIQGDKRIEMKEYLLEQDLTGKEYIHLHGY